MYLPGQQVTFLVYAIHALPHLVFAADITFHVREDTGLVGPQVILGAEEQHRELTDVMFHFLDVDRNCPRMANLSWPPPATHRRADETSGFPTSNSLRSMLLHGDVGKTCVMATSKAGGEIRGYWRRKACFLPATKCMQNSQRLLHCTLQRGAASHLNHHERCMKKGWGQVFLPSPTCSAQLSPRLLPCSVAFCLPCNHYNTSFPLASQCLDTHGEMQPGTTHSIKGCPLQRKGGGMNESHCAEALDSTLPDRYS